MESIINGYEVVEEINKGAFCDSYKVRKGGTNYFLKAYKDPTSMSEDYEQFKQNQRTMIPLLKSIGGQVENIVEDFELKGLYYQVKEFITGATNLRDWLNDNDNYDERLDVAIQFCEILKSIHGKNIVHQDLKPEQVMVVKDSSKKAGVKIILTDFDWSVPNGNIVRIVGTPGYGNIDGTSLSNKSDIFTYGIILCELLAGVNPFVITEKEEDRIFEPEKWKEWVTEKDYVLPIKINNDLPKSINDIIVACLEPEQSKRPTLDEIKAVLQGKPAPDRLYPRKKAKLRAPSGDVMIMVPGTGYGRKHFKELFGRTTDTDSNPVYKYLDKNYAVLSVVQEGEDILLGCPANGIAKNKIKLNGIEMSSKPTAVKNGDKISIFSTGKGTDIVTFTIEII